MTETKPFKKLTYRLAVKAKCLQCCCGSPKEVKNCPCIDCALYPYRLGKNPYRKSREYTEEEKEKLKERAKKARESKNER